MAPNMSPKMAEPWLKLMSGRFKDWIATGTMYVMAKQPTVLSGKTMNVSIPYTKDMLVTTAISVPSHVGTKWVPKWLTVNILLRTLNLNKSTCATGHVKV